MKDFRTCRLAIVIGVVFYFFSDAGSLTRAADIFIPTFDRWSIGSLIARGQEQESKADEGSEPEFPEQEEDHIETDRDSFTPATTTVASGRSILESAYSFIDNRDTFDTHSFPELLVRYGLNARVELRLGWNYEVGGAANAVSGSSIGELEEGAKLERESEISYGLKLGITEQDGWIPRSALVTQAFTPTSGPATNTDFVGTYVCGWELKNHWQVDAALRYGLTKEESDHFNKWSPSVVVKVPVRNRWLGHVEYFSINTSGKESDRAVHFISPGIHYLVTPDFEVGVRVGWGLNHDAPNFFNNVGIGWRF